ncbi:MAG: hypothetical protein EXS64_06625 [Candidatus Latescibacteria bacterium]|nr:hypothetical protein [Candidatus Latescibacterota bacterium]
MAWMLRITDTVPLANREAYGQKLNAVIDALPAHIRHRGSFRVAFGKSLEFMHLLEFASLSDYEQAPPETWTEVVEAYENGLATDSRWEWMRVIREGASA